MDASDGAFEQLKERHEIRKGFDYISLFFALLIGASAQAALNEVVLAPSTSARLSAAEIGACLEFCVT